jgi:hypothetical protein
LRCAANLKVLIDALRGGLMPALESVTIDGADELTPGTEEAMETAEGWEEIDYRKYRWRRPQ